MAQQTLQDTINWWQDARFGMFIHWGTYAMAARHEWIRNYEQISGEDYQKYFDYFDPDLFDPKAWAAMAKKAGMKYFVITTKHHEGFCLWDTQQTDYNAVKCGPGRDLVREYVDACRRAGLRVGILSGRSSDANLRRAEELGLDFVYQGEKDKGEAFVRLLREQNLSAEHCLYVGDDVVDMPVMRQAGVSVAHIKGI